MYRQPFLRRSLPDRLRYLASLLLPTDGTTPPDVDVKGVGCALEALADELEAGGDQSSVKQPSRN